MVPDPKAVVEQGSKLFAYLKKRGEASLTVTRVPYATDTNFSQNPPSCRVTITVTDPEDKEHPTRFFSDLFSATAPDNTCTFTIPVEKIFKLWGKKPRKLNIEISVDPTNGFEAFYNCRSDKVEMAAGTQKALAYSLAPKNEGDQKEGGHLLDKQLPSGAAKIGPRGFNT